MSRSASAGADGVLRLSAALIIGGHRERDAPGCPWPWIANWDTTGSAGGNTDERDRGPLGQIYRGCGRGYLTFDAASALVDGGYLLAWTKTCEQSIKCGLFVGIDGELGGVCVLPLPPGAPADPPGAATVRRRFPALPLI